jgi:glycosyltransferase involved in cell wall biosynthesis
MSNRGKAMKTKKRSKKILNEMPKKPMATPKDNSPSISVCMIVKDEEQFLEACLQSVKNVADEIIIIDTGSNDNTVNIAKKYTDKIYFHPWKDSFSEARNHYFEYATGDWIFQIDADEELVKDDVPLLLEAVKNPRIDAVMVQIVSQLNRGQSEARHNVERLFRNNGKIHYEGRVHNRLVGFKTPQIYPIHIVHYGYDLNDKELSEKKQKRRITLLKMDINDQPENPLPYHYLSCCYLPSGLFNETLEVGLRAIELANKANNENPIFLWTRYNLAMAYYKLKEYENAKSIALSAIAINKRHLDSYYILTMTSFDQLTWPEVIKYGNKYLHLIEQMKSNPEEFGTVVANSINESWNILVLKGIAYFETGKLADSKDSFQSAVSHAANPFHVLRAIGIFYYNKHSLHEAREYLKKAFDANKEDKSVKDLLDKIASEKQKKQTISCCMIVKNEEQFLEKCLSSVKDYVDEIIVVDTGSTDSTVEIAGKFTDKIYFHPWENSFSIARNQALQYATGDWIFQIDADEELMPGSGEKLRQVTRSVIDEDIIYVKIFCSYSNGSKLSLHNFQRLFRNNGIIHYEGSVHNRVIGGVKPLFSELELWHYGYDVEEKKAQEKFNRTTTLLKDEIDKDPENPLHHHYLSASYAARSMFKEALNEARKAILLADIQNSRHPFYSWTHFIASMSAYRLGSIEEARENATRALTKYPEHMDSSYILSVVAADKGEWDEVIRHGKTFLELLKRYQKNPEQSGLMINNTMNEGPDVQMVMGHAFHALNSRKQMNKHYAKAHDIANDKWRISWNIGSYHIDKSGDLELARHFLNLAAKEAPDEHDAWYMLAKLNKKCGLKNDEQNCLEKVIRIGTGQSFVYDRILSLYITEDLPDKAREFIQNHGDKIKSSGAMLCKTAVLYMEKGNIESAIKCYLIALEKEPDLFEAWASLGEITSNLNRLEESYTFFKRALEINKTDTEILLGLCYIGARRGDIESVISYCDMLLEKIDLPRDKPIKNIDDLKSILQEIETRLNKKNCSDSIKNIIRSLTPISDTIQNKSTQH